MDLEMIGLACGIFLAIVFVVGFFSEPRERLIKPHLQSHLEET